jgi:hypothetical protein
VVAAELVSGVLSAAVVDAALEEELEAAELSPVTPPVAPVAAIRWAASASVAHVMDYN